METKKTNTIEKNPAAVALAKRRHEVSPKPREFYQRISKLAAIARQKKKENNS